MSDKGSIVITGASTGMGEHCALGLAQRGYRVFAGVRKTADGDRLRSAGGANLTPVIVDVVNEAQVKEAARAVEQALAGAPLNALWNNAGISVNAPLEFITIEDLRRQLEVNVIGQVAATQAFLPMIRKSKGRILITGSIGGFFTTPMLVPYCMSKYAMESMADGLRRELRPFGVHVVLLEPGGIKSKIWEKGITESEQFIQKAPPEMMQVYSGLVGALRRVAPTMEKRSKSPQEVLDCVIHALESPKPKTRYRMGANSTAQKVISLLPDRVQDAFIAKVLGA
jgi:NAD(P)-dependent dehydrogenase (short-subunit alcohol dehydrogenase family)